MNTGRYARREKAIAATDAGTIRQRWEYGRMLLVDDTATTPAGNLRHGVLEGLIQAARKAGRSVSEREIQYRIQCARTYPCESQIRNAIADFETWFALTQARFPAYPAAEGERPYDPRTTRELERSAGGRILPGSFEQQELFARFDDDDTLAALQRYADEQSELTARFEARGAQRHAYLAALVKAVDGDLSRTYGEAKAALQARS